MSSRTIYALVARMVNECFSAIGGSHNTNIVVSSKDGSDMYGQSVDFLGGFESAKSRNEKNILHVVAGSHKTLDDVKATIAHEMLGHFVSNTYSLREKTQLLKRISDSRNDPSLSDAWELVTNDAVYSQKPLSVQAEEVFAMVAEKIDFTSLPDPKPETMRDHNLPINSEMITEEIVRCCHELRNGQRQQLIFKANGGHDMATSSWRSVLRDDAVKEQSTSSTFSPSN